MTAMDVLHKVYGMEVTKLSDEEVQAFRDKTQPVYARWAVESERDWSGVPRDAPT